MGSPREASKQEVPEEDKTDEDREKDVVGELLRAMPGTRDAANLWQEEVAKSQADAMEEGPLELNPIGSSAPMEVDSGVTHERRMKKGVLIDSGAAVTCADGDEEHERKDERKRS